MDRVYGRAKDLYVRVTYIYVNGEDDVAYSDSECTKPINAEDLKDLFLVGCIINDSGVLYAPTSFALVDGEASITYVKDSDGSAVLTTITSVEEE